MKLRRLGLDAFKLAAKSGEDLADVAVIRDLAGADVKALGVEPGKEIDARVFEFTISTENPEDDRSGDYVAVDGWRLDRYRKNPVILWAHDSSSPPIATAPAVWSEGKALRAKIDFSQTYDVSPFARMVCQLVGRKVLNATSVGFLPMVYAFNDTRGAMAMDFLEQEMLETSVVPVPANAEALQGAKGMGIDLAPMAGWAEAVLDGEHGPGLWVPKSLLSDDLIARARSIAKGEPDSVQVPEQIKSTREIVGSAAIHTPSQAGSTPAPATTKGAISYTTAHPDGCPKASKDASWDGPGEVAKASIDDLKVMCAWVDSANEQNKGAYKLPHHMAEGKHSVVWAGVKAAAARLDQTDIPEADKIGVRAHLAKHYEEFDEQPPWKKALEIDAVKALVEAIDKAGRVLSAANESTLREAHDAIQAASDRIGAVLEQVTPPNDGGGKSATGASLPVIEIVDAEPEPIIELTAEEVKAITEQVSRRVHEEFTLPLTGRLY